MSAMSARVEAGAAEGCGGAGGDGAAGAVVGRVEVDDGAGLGGAGDRAGRCCSPARRASCRAPTGRRARPSPRRTRSTRSRSTGFRLRRWLLAVYGVVVLSATSAGLSPAPPKAAAVPGGDGAARAVRARIEVDGGAGLGGAGDARVVVVRRGGGGRRERGRRARRDRVLDVGDRRGAGGDVPAASVAVAVYEVVELSAMSGGLSPGLLKAAAVPEATEPPVQSAVA